MSSLSGSAADDGRHAKNIQMQRENEKCGEMPKWIEPKVTSQFHSRNEIKHNERPIKLRSELIKLLALNLIASILVEKASIMII